MKGNRSRFITISAVCFLYGVLAAVPAVAQKGGTKVNGGGIAAFVDPRFGGGITSFSVGATVNGDGSANGHFECVIAGLLSWHITATGGTVNGDGSVTITGPSIVHFAGGGTFELDAFITFYAGGAGVGMFCAGPPTFPDTDCDVEVVQSGMIFIH